MKQTDSDQVALLSPVQEREARQTPAGSEKLPGQQLRPWVKMEKTFWTLGVLLISLVPSSYCTNSDFQGRKGPSKRVARSVDSADANDGKRCGYTFMVPQQKITGPICVSTKGPGPSKDQVTRMDLENLKDALAKQRREMEILQVVVDVDGNIVSEVKLLRKESRNMNSRVTQLYMQLLHEIIRKRDNSLEIAHLENKILNVTAEMLRAATRYKELEKRYASLVDVVNNQSTVISLLEEECMRVFSRRDPQGSPPLVQVVPQHIPNIQQYTPGLGGSNEIQRDTGYPRVRDSRQPPQPPAPTVSPFRVPPVTVIDEGPFRDCNHAKESGFSSSGIYLIKPKDSNRQMQLWCENSLDPGGWAVIQRRIDGSANFFRNWENYKKGFGNIDSEYWLGLENIYRLTSQDNYKLLIELEDWNNKKVYAEYSSFRLEPESDFYRLRLGTYQGNAGDSMVWHNGKQFTTLDRDRDMYTGNCAHFHKGGWWYNACAHANLNGVWYRGGIYRSKHQDGVYWAEYRGGSYSLKKVQMLIRPID